MSPSSQTVVRQGSSGGVESPSPAPSATSQGNIGGPATAHDTSITSEALDDAEYKPQNGTITPTLLGCRRSSCNAHSSSSSSSPALPNAQARSLPQTHRSRLSFSASNPRSFSPIIHPEPDKRGNLEYKLRILPVSASRFSRLVTQLKWRLAEGGGLAVYEIGVLDDGALVGLSKDEMRSSLAQLALMGKALGADCEIRRCILVEREASAEDEAGTEVASSLGQGVTTSSQLPPLDSGQKDTASPLPPSFPSPQLPAYRHRSQASSKNQSAGLDNIVGLRALNNADAAQLLGTGPQSSSRDPAHGWRFEIGESESEASDDIELPRRDSMRSESSGEVAATSSPEAEEDGFAFSLSLSDDDGPPPQTAVPATSKLPGESAAVAKLTRQSRSISNSPWEVRTPEYSPSHSAVRGHDSPSKMASTSGSPLAPSPLRAGGSPERGIAAGAPEGADGQVASAKPATDLSELEGLDVEGVMQFSLVDPRFASSGPGTSYASKTKRKSGRRRAAQWDMPPNGLNGGTHPIKATSEGATHTSSCHEQDLLTGLDALDEEPSLEAQALAARQAQVRKSSKPPRRHAQRPRHERTARRVAELKAREREGQGLLLALEPGFSGNPAGEVDAAVLDQALSQEEERAKWWRYSGLTLEGELPHYDITRQAWVREVADWLTVQEVRDLAATWAPVKKATTAPPERRGSHFDPSRIAERPIPVEAVSAKSPSMSTAASPELMYSSYSGPLDEEEQASAVALSRKALNRRKRKARKKAAAEADRASAQQAALAAAEAAPPSDAVDIPPAKEEAFNGQATRNGWAKHTDANFDWDGSEPSGELGQILEDDGSSEEPDDSFSMGLTLNIDEVCPYPGAPTHSSGASSAGTVSGVYGHANGSQRQDVSITAGHPQSTNGKVSVGAATAIEGQTEEQKGEARLQPEHVLEDAAMASDAGVRIIVEAVLSLPPVAAQR